MAGWRDAIVDVLMAPGSPITLAADPDVLLEDQHIVEAIRVRGGELTLFDDPVAFRLLYEERFRPALIVQQAGDEPHMRPIVVVRSNEALDHLPYDLTRLGRRAPISLATLFPSLSAAVVGGVDREDYEALFKQVNMPPVRHYARQTDDQTRDFLLRRLYHIDVAGIATDTDLLLMLLQHHYRERVLPVDVAGRLLAQLGALSRFAAWPLAELYAERATFLGFLQERWPLFLHTLARSQDQAVGEAPTGYMVVKGPESVPFGDATLRPYIDSLFFDNLLHPIEYEHAKLAVQAQTWVAVGIRIDRAADRARRLAGLRAKLDASIPAPDALYHAWHNFAARWAELVVLWHEAESPRTDQAPFAALRERIDTAFQKWLQARYGALHNLAAASPVMVHQIPRFLAGQLQDQPNRKLALLVLDGMALDQWVLVRQALAVQRPKFVLREAAIFAWIPTITPVSRQALFSGVVPNAFAATIENTDKDEAGWRRHWLAAGLRPEAVLYMRSLRDQAGLETLTNRLESPRLRVVGLVADHVDQMAHGTVLGTGSLHSQVRHWLGTGFLVGLLDLLLDRGYRIFLTADHGNLEAVGMGRPAEGAAADSKGERVRIYRDDGLRASAHARLPQTIVWSGTGLPSIFMPLLAAGHSAFVSVGERIVGHGGSALEEVIVPFVTIDRGQL